MLPRRYFPLVHLDQPLPTDLATGEALHVAGTLERLTAVVELQDGNSWTAGEFVIEGVDTPAPDLEVGVLAVALLAGDRAGSPCSTGGTPPSSWNLPRWKARSRSRPGPRWWPPAKPARSC